MNNVRQIQELNRRELENGISPEASWHTDYRDTAWVYIGGLPFELSEGDIITIFSQYGEPTTVDLIRDKDTGKSRGFAFLKYEDQRSTDLAVDNLGGAVILGKTLRVDHTRYKKKDEPEPETKPEDDANDSVSRAEGRRSESESEGERPMLKEERELALLIQDHDDDDPMKDYLIQEKRAEVAAALERWGESHTEKSRKRRRHHSSRDERRDDRHSSRKSSKHHSSRPRSSDLHRRERRSETDRHRRHRSRSKEDSRRHRREST